jgi:hypothetical protein
VPNSLLSFYFMRRHQGVVNFVSNRIPPCNAFPLMIPKATTPTRPRLSPHVEGEEKEEGNGNESSDSSSSRSSVGARGIPLSFGTPSALSEASVEDDDDEIGEREDEESDDESTSSSSSSSSEEEEGNFADTESPEKDSTRSVCGAEDDLQDEVVAYVVDDQNDDELSDILQSLGEDRLVPEPDELDSSERFIGVMEDRDDLITIPKSKRVLSYNTLAALNIEARGKDHSPKRQKAGETSCQSIALLPSFSLGPPAFSLGAIGEDSTFRLSMRRESPIISSSSDDEEELDRRLGAELREQGDGRSSENNTPVPLLTPPGSPLTIEVDGETRTVCEWPSNLVVDSAMAAASELRPMSPTSLEDLERMEYQRRPEAEASMLTPLLRGIYVGDD